MRILKGGVSNHYAILSAYYAKRMNKFKNL